MVSNFDSYTVNHLGNSFFFCWYVRMSSIIQNKEKLITLTYSLLHMPFLNKKKSIGKDNIILGVSSSLHVSCGIASYLSLRTVRQTPLFLASSILLFYSMVDHQGTSSCERHCRKICYALLQALKHLMILSW